VIGEEDRNIPAALAGVGRLVVSALLTALLVVAEQSRGAQ
jgi:hypothetical protein